MNFATIAAFALAISSPAKNYSWKSIIDQLAPHIIRVARDHSDGNGPEAVNEILRTLGVGADENEYGYENGFFSDEGVQPVNVRGLKDGLLVMLERRPGKDVPAKTSSRLVLFSWEGNQYRGTSIICHEDDCWGIAAPDNALIFNGRIVIASKAGWMSNIPYVQFNTMAKRKGQWALIRQKATWNDAFSVPKLKLSKDGKSIRPATVVVNHYPAHLMVGHAQAQITEDYFFTFPDGLASCKKIVTRYTPFVELDNLALAIMERKWPEIRKRCASRKLAKRVAALFWELSPEVKEYHSNLPCLLLGDNGEPYMTQDFALTDQNVFLHFGKRQGRWVVTKMSRWSKD